MQREYLYSPWRLDYILSEKPEDCVLCRHNDCHSDKDNLILVRSSHSYVMLNRYPYNNGHLMVVPYLHAARLEALSKASLEDIIMLLATCEKALYMHYRCDGLNIGMNQGKAGGAGIDEHLHWHLVPRWNGDSNFMSVVSGQRVIPEAFEKTFDDLRQVFAKLLECSE